MKKQIPNLITLLNLLCGCIAVVFAASNQLHIAAAFVFLGILFDFFDGFAARMLDVKSELGLQLDSLADMVTSGVVPGLVMFQMLSSLYLEDNTGITINLETISLKLWEQEDFRVLPFLGFLITLGSGYRLAKFNIDENQTSSFIGLPTPANTILILSLPLILKYQEFDQINMIIQNKWFLIGLTILSAILMNANIALFALKFKNFSFKGNEIRYIFLISSIVLLVFLKFLAIPIIILLYISLSVLNKNIGNKRKEA
ncbi:phosphatidylserine synthase [Flavobacteriaceae bacterium R38]|nr:phosphatidylserine synthase [Flavobacteriaceae bacterium R38]